MLVCVWGLEYYILSLFLNASQEIGYNYTRRILWMLSVISLTFVREWL